ncbi:MAG: PIG-L family deacetylase [Bacteroidia bacterium]|nr:PIG-L family deacetylase [Bacteroidia bacterium]
MIHKNVILVLAPHTDDGELGCGGTIARLVAEGKEVHYVAFSICEKSVPAGLPANTLEIEVKAATRELGIPENQLHILDYDVRTFPQFRQEILEDMVKLRSKIKPDLVILPAPTDIHQDHATISQEGIRAFKNASILGYEMPWNNITFHARSYVTLQESDVQAKVRACAQYKSQGFRPYMQETFIRSMLSVRGIAIGKEYAEAFDVVRWML